MPTSVRAAHVLCVGGSNRSEPLARSSRRIAKLIRRNAPMRIPDRTATTASVMRAAMAASEYFRAAVTRGFPSTPHNVLAGLLVQAR